MPHGLCIKKVNILDTPVFYINMEKDKEKRARMEAMLGELGFKSVTRVEGPEGPDKNIGCSSAHLSIMSSQRVPFIILEDDCMEKTFLPELTVPTLTDCVYLGIANRGTHGDENAVTFFRYNDQLVRLHSMLTTHAMLFLTEPYRKMGAELIKGGIESSLRGEVRHADGGYAGVMPEWNVFAVADPMFYQEKCCLKTNIRFKTDCPYIDDSVES